MISVNYSCMQVERSKGNFNFFYKNEATQRKSINCENILINFCAAVTEGRETANVHIPHVNKSLVLASISTQSKCKFSMRETCGDVKTAESRVGLLKTLSDERSQLRMTLMCKSAYHETLQG